MAGSLVEKFVSEDKAHCENAILENCAECEFSEDCLICLILRASCAKPLHGIDENGSEIKIKNGEVIE